MSSEVRKVRRVRRLEGEKVSDELWAVSDG
jgi:hypothetical protein